ncbi:MAG: hypothetical protein M1830_004777 [Pleopsidium flavum]|nr:MAG: hypothetical protein M1830_004777 [Pleopsidium flavum]
MAVEMQGKGKEPTPTGLDAEKALEQPLELLRTKDNTYRFVGLALLKSILDNQQSLLEDPRIIAKCWAAISPKFLDALLQASENEGRNKQEAQSMVELAVAVIHAFLVLLPSESCGNVKMVLLTFASEIHGACELLDLDLEDSTALYEICVQEPLALDVIKHAFITRTTVNNVSHELMRVRLDETVSGLIRNFRDAEPTRLFVCLNDVFNGVPSWILHHAKWFPSLIVMIHTSIVCSQHDVASDVRMAALELSATLLRLYGEHSSVLLFKPSVPVSRSLNGKPFVYLFIKLLLVDIHGTIPSLLGMLTSPTFANTCKRLTASYDIIVGFVGYLLKSLDYEDTDPQGTIDSLLPSDLLLRLRTDIAEAMSLTIEYMRDRYDAAVDGRSDSRASMHFSMASRQSPNPPLILPSDFPTGGVPEVQLAAAQVRALSLWLREDDNERLRKEAVGIIDVLLSLYSSTAGDDVRSPVVVALQGITAVAEGVETFLDRGGWTILFEDLKSALASSNAAEEQGSTAIEIVRLLLAIVESTPFGTPREEWMEFVPASVRGLMPKFVKYEELDLRIGSWQLSVELLTRAPTPMRGKYVKEAQKIIDLARDRLDRRDDERLREGLSEVIDGIVELYPDLEATQ